ncbi:MAG TPA: acyltransferase domain-containing protein [Symbiobacteriaceae bacterium]|nr:acyltransferase domain-containing protein [Symbiobacteriaceae bacterium]
MNGKVAVLFPGQGAFYGGALHDLAPDHPEIESVFADVDKVAQHRLGRSVSDVIFSPRKPDIKELLRDHPDVLQLALYGVDVAAYRLMEAKGLQPGVLMGHSFGEIAALVCAGAYSVRQGAEIVCHRIAALARLGEVDGAMLALGTDREQAEQLVAVVRNAQTVISGENHTRQILVSGPKQVVNVLHEMAKTLKLSAVILNSPYPFHSPLLQGAVADFAGRLRAIPQSSLRVPVYSPIMGRYYSAEDDLGKCLAEHLVMPINFAPAVRQLHMDGMKLFVEAGALDTLVKLARNILAGKDDVTMITTLDPVVGERASLENALKMLQDRGALFQAGEVSGSPVFQEFWASHGQSIMNYIRLELESFAMHRGAPGTEPAAAAIAAAPAPEVVPAAEVVSPAVTRDVILDELSELYATALEYPREVFTADVALEAELGVDSVKQTELMARVSDKYGLPPHPADFRLSNYPTLGHIADFVMAHAPAVAAAPVAAVVAAPAPAPVVAASSGAVTRTQLFQEMVTFYADALEYPVEVFTEDVALEAELGIDSVKQTELMARVSDKYALPPHPADFRLSNYPTMGAIVDFVFATMPARH